MLAPHHTHTTLSVLFTTTKLLTLTFQVSQPATMQKKKKKSLALATTASSLFFSNGSTYLLGKISRRLSFSLSGEVASLGAPLAPRRLDMSQERTDRGSVIVFSFSIFSTDFLPLVPGSYCDNVFSWWGLFLFLFISFLF